jgi:group I intron endonuclease
MKTSIVYVATNAVNGKRYVGRTDQNIRARWNQHVSVAGRGSDLPFHRAIRKYGAGAFWLHIVAACSAAESVDAETEWIASLGTFGRGGYNATAGGEGTSGYKMSDAQRAKVIAARRNQVMRPEHMAVFHRRGRVNTQKHRDACAASLRGQKRTPEQVARIAAAHLGIPLNIFLEKRAHGLKRCSGYGLSDAHWYPEAEAAAPGRAGSTCRTCRNAYERSKRAKAVAA